MKSAIFNQYYFEDFERNIFATKKKITWWLSYFFSKNKSPIVHFHQFSPIQFFYFYIFTRTCKNKVIITIHNEKILSYSIVYKFLLIKTIKYTHAELIISASKRVNEYLIHKGVVKTKWLPAYVPPTLSKPIEQDANSINTGLIFFNAWRISCSKDFDLYGCDLLFQLAKDRPTLKFKIFIGDIGSKSYIDHILVSEYVPNVEFVFGESLVDQLPSAKLFIRPSRQDAYGISLQEALDLDVPAIASDVCSRPQGTILFKTGKYSDFLEKIDFALSSPREALLSGRNRVNYHIELVDLYRSILREIPIA
ncbi:glycosyltransferase [Hydrogenophaga sp.]|uniref:glycosyltransferase n=1 Tax=Hydrogenophaga sp. TaxID=1904254 RepID=UPI003F6C673B